MSDQDTENIDLEQAKWRVRHVQGLLSHHRTKRQQRNHLWRVDELELIDRLSHAHVDLEKVLHRGRAQAKDPLGSLPLPAL